MKKCPYCAEEIQDEAIVCKHCGRDLVPQPKPAEPAKQNNGGAAVIIILVVLVAIFVFFSFGRSSSNDSSPSSSSSPSELAWTACTVFIERTLDLGTTEAQRYSASNVKGLGSDRYAIDVYYANVNTTYRCTIQRHSNGDTELLDLSVKE